jgi:magnesium-protoporphyrin O-methyltransferase
MSVTTPTYETRRGELETYFDRTAVDAWAKLTTDAPVSKIRATVRAGRDLMRNTLLSWLPEDLTGRTLLDAGCGTGALSVEAARRGAAVTAIDLSPTLVQLARERLPEDLVTSGGAGHIDFRSGDMLDPALGDFDHVVCMDSLIHYKCGDMAEMLAGLAARTRHSILFTHAPRTPLLTAMHAAGRLFPRGDRAPAIEPVANGKIVRMFEKRADTRDWFAGRQFRVTSGFYMSQAQELLRR